MIDAANFAGLLCATNLRSLLFATCSPSDSKAAWLQEVTAVAGLDFDDIAWNAEAFNSQHRIKATQIPYKGAAPLIPEVISGQVDAAVAAATEGFLFGIPAIAFSQVEHGWAHLDDAADAARDFVMRRLDDLARPFLLNVNIPNRPYADLQDRKSVV